MRTLHLTMSVTAFLMRFKSPRNITEKNTLKLTRKPFHLRPEREVVKTTMQRCPTHNLMKNKKIVRKRTNVNIYIRTIQII